MPVQLRTAGQLLRIPVMLGEQLCGDSASSHARQQTLLQRTCRKNQRALHADGFCAGMARGRDGKQRLNAG